LKTGDGTFLFLYEFDLGLLGQTDLTFERIDGYLNKFIFLRKSLRNEDPG
jgi:hypothetical protein